MHNTHSEQRRDFLKTSVKGAIALGVGVSIVNGLATSARAAGDVSMMGDPKPVKDEESFRNSIIGPVMTSMAASQIGVEKATDKDAKEFAGFELTETTALSKVLKAVGTPLPTPDAKAKATLEKLQSAEKGPAFDKAFIEAQLETHKFLRDTTEDFLKNSQPSAGPAEVHVEHLATVSLATFKEHVLICERIAGELKA